MEQCHTSKCVVKNWKKQNVPIIYEQNKIFGSTFCFIHRCNKTENYGGRYYGPTEDSTDEIIMNKTNFTEISHRHDGRCFSTISPDGL